MTNTNDNKQGGCCGGGSKVAINSAEKKGEASTVKPAATGESCCNTPKTDKPKSGGCCN